MRGRGPERWPRDARARMVVGLLIAAVIAVALVWFIATYPSRDPQQAPDAVILPQPGQGRNGN